MFTDFEFADKRLSDFGWITCHIDSNVGVSEVDIGCDITFNTVKNNHSSIHYKTSTSYDNVCTSQPFVIMKNPCGKNQEDMYAIHDEIRVLTKWLNRHEYRKFKPIYDSDEFSDVHFYGSFNVKQKTINDRIVGLVLTFTGNAPYGFGEHVVNEVDMENNEVTVSGENVYITDCAAVPPESIKLFGKSKQDSVPGNQLFDVDQIATNVSDECSIINNGDGTLTVEGSGTLTSSFNSAYVSYDMNTKLKVGNLYLNNEANTTPVFHVYGVNSSEERLFTVRHGSYVEITQEILDTLHKVVFTIYGSNGAEIIAGTVKPMLYQEGDGTWEPYVGGEASPNMNYPQSVESHGDGGSIVEKVLNGNIFNSSFRSSNSYNPIFTNGCTATESNGVFTCVCTKEDMYVWNIKNQGEVYAESDYTLCEVMVIPNDVSEISITLSNSEFNKNFIIFYDKDKKAIKWISHTTNVFTQAVLDGAKYFTIRFGKGDAIVGTTYETTVMVNYGEPMDYVPYTEQPFTALTPNGFMGLPVFSRGNYVDSDGQQYLSNYKDYAIGKNVEQVQKIKFTSDLAWIYEVGTTNGTHNFKLNLNKNGYGKASYVYHYCIATKSTHFRFINVTWDNVEESKIYVWENELTVSFASDSEMNSLEAWKQFIDENEVYVCYILAEPIITDLTEEELAEYNALVMNKPVTTIVSEANIEVTYLQDYDNSFSICGDSDEYVTLYPNIAVTCKRDGDLRITNTLTGNVFEVLNCSKDETIYINGEHKFIDSDNENHKNTTLFNDFNYNFLDINVTEDDFSENIYETSMPCKIVIDYSPIRKVGV